MRRIAYIQYTNPAGYPALEHSSQILADDRWKVLFLGTSVDGIESLRFPPHPGITVRRLSTSRPGWRQKAHYCRFVFWAAIWALASRCRWVYASDPLACPAGLLLSFAPWIQVIYHEHDSPTTSRNGRGVSRFMRFVFWTRRALANRAALCVLPNQRRAELFAQDPGRRARILCVWNCPAKKEIGAARTSFNGDALWVMYHGSLVPSRLPATVIEALAMLPEKIKLRMVGYETIGHKGYVAELQSLARKLGVVHRVEFVGTIPTRAELFERCGNSDVGLAFMPKFSQDINEQAMTGASNKPFDYLACGLALLVSDLPDWRALYVDNGHALPIDPEDPDSIVTALRWLLDHPDERRAMGQRGRERILADWNYEKQFAPVLECLNAGTR